jgi:hypothetical protein
MISNQLSAISFQQAMGVAYLQGVLLLTADG